MATTPIYFTTPGVANVQVTAANASVATYTTGQQVLVGTASGRRISRVRVAHAIDAAPSSNKVSFWISTDNGTTKRFVCDGLLGTPGASSATVRVGYAEVPELVGKVLFGTTNILYATSWIAQAANIDVEYNDA